MVFALETQHGKVHEFGVRLEEMLIVTDTGSRADHDLPDRRDHARGLIAMSAAPLALDDPAARDPAVVGVKAAGLAAAAGAGLPVLPGWVLPLEASAAAIAAGARALETRRGVRARTSPRWRPPSSGRLPVERSAEPANGGPSWCGRPRPSTTTAAGRGRSPATSGSRRATCPPPCRGCWASAFSGDALGRCAEAGDRRGDAPDRRAGAAVPPARRRGDRPGPRRRHGRRRRGAGRSGWRGRRPPGRPRRDGGGGREDRR